HRRYPRDWIDPEDGSLRYEARMTPDKGARFKKVLQGFTDQIFNDARRAGIRDTYEQYAADALVAMAEAARASADGTPVANIPKYTKSLVHIVIIADASAWTPGYTKPGDT